MNGVALLAKNIIGLAIGLIVTVTFGPFALLFVLVRSFVRKLWR